jgi:hypothetical protein
MNTPDVKVIHPYIPSHADWEDVIGIIAVLQV